MNKVCKLLLLLALVLVATTAVAGSQVKEGNAVKQKMVSQAPGEFVAVDFDEFVVAEKGKVPEGGKRLIKMADPISFLVSIKRLPEERDMKYVYTALEVAGVQPMPKVNHRMFVESEAGRIVPVYVESNAAEKFAANLHEDEHVELLGYHLYNYAKGPAILVVDYRRPDLH